MHLFLGAQMWMYNLQNKIKKKKINKTYINKKHEERLLKFLN